jgi:hypothetical protein
MPLATAVFQKKMCYLSNCVRLDYLDVILLGISLRSAHT